jgi:putative intracellular protease/amidase
MGAGKILIIATNVDQFKKSGQRTGLWLGELTHFWDKAQAAGFEMDIASPLGGKIPIDPESLWLSRLWSFFKIPDRLTRRYRDRKFMDRLNHTMRIADARVDDYAAIYITGGHGVMFDLPQCPELARLVAAFWEKGKIVSAVCHGVAGLLEAKLSDGAYLIKDKAVTGFSWDEEDYADREDVAPFNLEEQLRKRGAKYRKNFPLLEPFWPFVEADDRLITGQNPISAGKVGKAVVKALIRPPVAVPPTLAHA